MTKEQWRYGPWPLVVLMTVLALLVASSATAESTLRGPDQAGVDAKAVVEKLEAAGYQQIHDLEWDDGFWELEATSPKGLPVDLVVDPDTGDVLHEEVD